MLMTIVAANSIYKFFI